jgi:DNA-binding XRE family transcriptional regulator
MAIPFKKFRRVIYRRFQIDTTFHHSESLVNHGVARFGWAFNRTVVMMNTKTIEKIDAREIRHKLGLNQQQFWSTLGVTQSGGSRYESGRNMPKPVREL